MRWLPVTSLSLLLASATLAPIARADEPDPARTLALADGKLSRGLYEDAAKLYEQARPGPGSAAAYNRGLALLKADKTQEGESQLRDVVASATDARVAADAAFNLGRSLHDRALKDKNEQEGLTLLTQAEGAFRACIDAAPADREAAKALELTRREIKKIQDEQQKKSQEEQKQQQQQDQQRKEEQQKLADQLKDLADKQQQAEQKTAQNQEQAKQNPDQNEQSRQQSQNDQKAVSDQTQSAAKKLDEQRQNEPSKSKADSPMDKAQQSMDQARQEQRQAEQALQNGDFDKAREHQNAAADKLREAAQSIEDAANAPPPKSSDEKKEQQAQGTQGDQNKDAENKEQQAQPAKAEPTKEKPKGDALANRLLDREEEARKARARLIRSMQGAPTPVERDW